MALQIFAKIMTMSMNFLVARFVQKEVYGYANIQLHLFYSMILFYSKEAVRKSCQRELHLSTAHSRPTINRSALNLVLLSLPRQLLLSLLTYLFVTHFYPPPLAHFRLSLFLTCFSALLENLCEPFYLVILQRMEMSKRVKAEGLAIFVKSILLYMLISLYKDSGLLAFAGA